MVGGKPVLSSVRLAVLSLFLQRLSALGDGWTVPGLLQTKTTVQVVEEMFPFPYGYLRVVSLTAEESIVCFALDDGNWTTPPAPAEMKCRVVSSEGNLSNSLTIWSSQGESFNDVQIVSQGSTGALVCFVRISTPKSMWCQCLVKGRSGGLQGGTFERVMNINENEVVLTELSDTTSVGCFVQGSNSELLRCVLMSCEGTVLEVLTEKEVDLDSSVNLGARLELAERFSDSAFLLCFTIASRKSTFCAAWGVGSPSSRPTLSNGDMVPVAQMNAYQIFFSKASAAMQSESLAIVCFVNVGFADPVLTGAQTDSLVCTTLSRQGMGLVVGSYSNVVDKTIVNFPSMIPMCGGGAMVCYATSDSSEIICSNIGHSDGVLTLWEQHVVVHTFDSGMTSSSTPRIRTSSYAPYDAVACYSCHLDDRWFGAVCPLSCTFMQSTVCVTTTVSTTTVSTTTVSTVSTTATSLTVTTMSITWTSFTETTESITATSFTGTTASATATSTTTTFATGTTVTSTSTAVTMTTATATSTMLTMTTGTVTSSTATASTTSTLSATSATGGPDTIQAPALGDDEEGEASAMGLILAIVGSLLACMAAIAAVCCWRKRKGKLPTSVPTSVLHCHDGEEDSVTFKVQDNNMYMSRNDEPWTQVTALHWTSPSGSALRGEVRDQNGRMAVIELCKLAELARMCEEAGIAHDLHFKQGSGEWNEPSVDELKEEDWDRLDFAIGLLERLKDQPDVDVDWEALSDDLVAPSECNLVLGVLQQHHWAPENAQFGTPPDRAMLLEDLQKQRDQHGGSTRAVNLLVLSKLHALGKTKRGRKRDWKRLRPAEHKACASRIGKQLLKNSGGGDADNAHKPLNGDAVPHPNSNDETDARAIHGIHLDFADAMGDGSPAVVGAATSPVSSVSPTRKPLLGAEGLPTQGSFLSSLDDDSTAEGQPSSGSRRPSGSGEVRPQPSPRRRERPWSPLRKDDAAR